VTIGGTVRERVGGNLHATVLGERRDRIGGAHSVMIGGDRQEMIGGRWAVQADGAIHLVSDQAIVVEAPDGTIKGAGGVVRVGAEGVTTHGGWPVIQPGAPGAGAGSDPAAPELPGGGALPVERRRVRLPLLGFGGALPMASASSGRDCDQEQIECFRRCWNSK